MLRYTSGDLLKDSAEAIVNTVNCVGVMGRGIALQFKKTFPTNFAAYKQACNAEQVKPGQMFVTETGQLTNPRYIINFPTKRHWRQKSRMEDVESGLQALRETIKQYNIQSIAIPPLGCGLGGLNWPDVKARIEAALADCHNTEIRVYEPKGAPQAAAMKPAPRSPKMTPGRAALLHLMKGYHRYAFDASVTLLAVHKLLYFLQLAGEPLRLEFAKHKYGPYSVNLSKVLNAIEGHFISGYGDGGDQPTKPLDILPKAADHVLPVLQKHPSTMAHTQRVLNLIEGFESDFGLELLATVCWTVDEHKPNSLGELVEQVHAWNVRKRAFEPRQIRTAFLQLQKHGFVPATLTLA